MLLALDIVKIVDRFEPCKSQPAQANVTLSVSISFHVLKREFKMSLSLQGKYMAKYSTGNAGGSDGGGACELCGKASDRLTAATVAGAQLRVCSDCASHGEPANSGTSSSRKPSEQDRKRRAVKNTAKANDVWEGDSERWESEGTNYDDDPLPYLVSKYGERTTAARQELGLQRDEVADELGIPENDLLAVEQGQANRAGIGGSVIEALEERLDVTLSE